jgi:Mg-chelatase subunit ChlI
MSSYYPFSAIVSQDALKRALLLNVINPGIGGVLIRGEKGTAKSTAVRALSGLLPSIEVVDGCFCGCSPDGTDGRCPQCSTREGEPPVRSRRVKVTEIPIGATEDRVVGSLNLETALKTGSREFEPGLLAEAHRGILYVDEVNLLADHLVDVLLDVAAMGVNTIEREGVSWSHPSRFVLVGTMNPEEGELRPQFLDRFGLCVEVRGLYDAAQRLEVVKRRVAFEDDPESFLRNWRPEEEALAENLSAARRLLPQVRMSEVLLKRLVETSIDCEVDGHRADIVMLKACKTLAALDNRTEVSPSDLEEAASLALPHRLRRQPFQTPEPSGQRVVPFTSRSTQVTA